MKKWPFLLISFNKIQNSFSRKRIQTVKFNVTNDKISNIINGQNSNQKNKSPRIATFTESENTDKKKKTKIQKTFLTTKK